MTIAQKLMQEGKLEGIKEGLRKGEQDTRLDIARAMLREGADPAFIIKTTGLTKHELAQLQH